MVSRRGIRWERGASSRDRGRPIERADAVQILADTLDNSLYGRLELEAPSSSHHIEYEDDVQFWADALARKHFQGERILLTNFVLSEWIPAAPGRYFTPGAAYQRERAFEWLEPDNPLVFRPRGKQAMILGGVGSLRLGPRHIDGETFYLLGASASGISHEGIVVALSEHQYDAVVRIIREHGGCAVNIVGSIRVLPPALRIIQYGSGIPRHCILVDDLDIHHPREALVSVSITFAAYGSRNPERARLEKTWAFAYFRAQNHDEMLPRTVNWLQGYAERYSGRDDTPPILSDFDEHYAHFPQVEFPLAHLSQGNVDIGLLLEYQHYYGFHINMEVVMGDVFKNISGSTIVSRSMVEQSFNRVKATHDEQTANALLRVAEEISKSGNVEAGELFAGFNEELERPEPRKSVLRGLWHGMTAALPTLSQMVDVVQQISKLFA